LLFQAVFVALVLVLIAPLASQYFDEPRVDLVIYALAVSELISVGNEH